MVVKVLIDRGANLEAKIATNIETFYQGSSALYVAVMNKQKSVVETLITRDADVKTRPTCRQEWTALHFASFYGYTDIAKLLLDAGIDIEAKEEVGWTALHLACHYGNTETARTLLDAQANTNAETNIGWTPLHIASRNKYADIVSMLLEKDVVIDHKTREGFTALDYARGEKREDIIKMLETAGARDDELELTNRVSIAHPATASAQVRKPWIRRAFS